MSFHGWCTHCMKGRGRTHRHLSKKRSEDWSRRKVIAMGFCFLKPKSTASSQTIPEESVDVHCGEGGQTSEFQKGIEELWASERVARCINSLGYKEITLKSDTEPAIIAFRNRVPENCNAEVTSEDAVKGDKPPKKLVENAVVLLRGDIRTIKCHVESCTQEEL